MTAMYPVPTSTASSGLSPRRHVLVVGAQCHIDSPAERANLERAAQGLHRALVDQDLGGCTDLGEGRSLLVDLAPGKEVVTRAIDAAVDRARKDGGTLVLAFLGHGVGGYGGRTYFVTSGSQNEQAVSHELDVTSVIEAAVNDTALGGLIVVVDTCYAAGAVPSPASLTSGIREGRVACSLLFATSATMPAWNMRLSIALTGLIEEGMPDAGDHLLVDQRLTGRLRDRIITTQTPADTTFNGTPLPGGYLWLSHNARAPRRVAAGSLGRVAQEQLRKALARLDVTEDIGSEAELKAWLAQADTEARLKGPALQRVQELHTYLGVCTAALLVLNEIFGPKLTEDQLRQAILRTPHLPLELLERRPCPSLRDLVEHCVFLAPQREPRELLAQFAAALTHVSGRAEAPRRLLDWATNLSKSQTVNTRLRELADAMPRLVLVAADDRTERVVRVEASLLFGEAVTRTERFECAPGGEADALDRAVSWALVWLSGTGERLLPVDLAVPTLQLLDSPLEWRKLGGRRKYRLGSTYEVTTRWSGLITPPSGIHPHEMLTVGQELLAALRNVGGDGEVTDDVGRDDDQRGPEWLGDEELASLEVLQNRLDMADMAVWGMSVRPERDFALMAEELLIYSPALLWPWHERVPDVRPLRDAVARHWSSLPESLRTAHRNRHRNRSAPGDDTSGPLADIRAAWHDEHWQAFCRGHAGRQVVAPPEYP